MGAEPSASDLSGGEPSFLLDGEPSILAREFSAVEESAKSESKTPPPLFIATLSAHHSALQPDLAPLLSQLELHFHARHLGQAHLLLAKGIALSDELSLEKAGPLHLWKELLDLASCTPLAPQFRIAHAPKGDWELLIGLARLERMRWERSAVVALRGGVWLNPLAEELFAERFDGEMSVEGLSWSESKGEAALGVVQNSEWKSNRTSASNRSDLPNRSDVSSRSELPNRADESNRSDLPKRSSPSKQSSSSNSPSPILNADPKLTLTWPWQQEVWPDEFPLPPPIESLCGDLALFDEALAQHSDGLRGWMAQELTLSQELRKVVHPQHPIHFALLVQEASLLLAQGELDTALELVGDLEKEQLNRALPPHRDALSLLRALRLENAGESQQALEIFEELQSSPYLRRQRAFVATRVLAALAVQGRWQELLERFEAPLFPLVDEPSGSAGRAWLSWLKGKALAELGEDARLFEHVRKSLRAHPRWQDDAALSLLADLLYRRLSQSNFGDKVLELMEALASPREIYLRLERLAQVAFEADEYAFSESVIRWLLANHKAPAVQPRYQGLWARVAFEKGDLQRFRVLVKELSTSSLELQRAIPPGRRGSFFQERDEELLALLSHVLSRLPEKNSKAWGTVLADHLSHFLRESEQSRVYEQVVELYRSLRGMLEEDDRAWAERVGASAPVLVLGEWVVKRQDLWPKAPRAPLRLEEPDYLVHVPVDIHSGRFTLWLGESAKAAFKEPESEWP